MAASGEKPPVPLKYQIWVLKVLIHCEGCKKKIRRILRSIEGVYTVEIDEKQQQITVIGDIDGATLVKKLARRGKHAQVVPAMPQPKEKQSESKKMKKNEDRSKEGKKENEESAKPIKDLLQGEEQVEEKDRKPDGNKKQSKKVSTNVDAQEKNKVNNKPQSKAQKAESMGEGSGGGGRSIQPTAVEVNEQGSLQSEGYVATPACTESRNTAWPCMSSRRQVVPPPAPCCVRAPHLKGGWYYYVPLEDENPSAACNLM